MSNVPQTNPGEILNWPMLKIQYQTTPEAIAKLLPPGIDASESPTVYLTIYNFPILNEPEHGVVVSVAANCDGIEGEYTLLIGIDQEAPVIRCQERWGQPKCFAKVEYYRMIDKIAAKATHAGYTFLEFEGKITGPDDNLEAFETNEFWTKYSRSYDMSEGKYDLPPRVIRVNSQYGTAYKEKVEGHLTLRESPWDPIATLLPVKSEPEAHLWTPIFKGRQYLEHKQLDGAAFWPYCETISGSRWPGEGGGPLKS